MIAESENTNTNILSFKPLEHLLKPIQPLLDDSNVSEILIDRPGEVWFEKNGQIASMAVPKFNYLYLEDLAKLIANECKKSLRREPLLIASLPDDSRVQIVTPPATLPGHILIAIRRKVVRNLTLQDYKKTGTFNHVNRVDSEVTDTNYCEADDKDLQDLYQQGHYFEFLLEAIRLKKNILISAGTGVGKTTFLNACLREIPDYERIGILEDVQEVDIPHRKQFRLLVSRNPELIEPISMQKLVQTALRLRPDRIIMGEIRGAEAWDFLNATSTGHDGSITTIHATNPKIALMRLVHMIKLNKEMAAFTKEDILSDIYNVVDIIVQLKRERELEGKDYHRYISSIYVPKFEVRR